MVRQGVDVDIDGPRAYENWPAQAACSAAVMLAAAGGA